MLSPRALALLGVAVASSAASAGAQEAPREALPGTLTLYASAAAVSEQAPLLFTEEEAGVSTVVDVSASGESPALYSNEPSIALSVSDPEVP